MGKVCISCNAAPIAPEDESDKCATCGAPDSAEHTETAHNEQKPNEE